jgi:hypothetical protein
MIIESNQTVRMWNRKHTPNMHLRVDTGPQRLVGGLPTRMQLPCYVVKAVRHIVTWPCMFEMINYPTREEEKKIYRMYTIDD